MGNSSSFGGKMANASPFAEPAQHAIPARSLAGVRVLVMGHDDLSLENAVAIRSAIETMGGKASIFRYDGHGRFQDLRVEAEGMTHFLLAVGKYPRFEESLLSVAEARAGKVGLICLDSAETLLRHTSRIRRGGIIFAVVNSDEEQRATKRRWSDLQVIVVDDLRESASEIARAFVV